MELKVVLFLVSCLTSTVMALPLAEVNEVSRDARQGILEYPKQLAAVLSGVISESLDRLSKMKSTTILPVIAAALPPAPVTSKAVPAAATLGPIESFPGEAILNNVVDQFEQFPTNASPTRATTLASIASQVNPVTEEVKNRIPVTPPGPIVIEGGSGFPTNVDEDISILGIATSNKPPKRVPNGGNVNLESIAFPGGLQQPAGNNPPAQGPTDEDDEATTPKASPSTTEDDEAEASPAETTADVETEASGSETSTGTDEEEEVDEAEEGQDYRA